MAITISGDSPNFSSATITSGTITTGTITTGTITTLNAPSGVLATQNGMTGIAKAWVQFNGSSATIAGSFNVSSITRNGTGDYTVNFTTAMPNANYAASGFSGTNRLVAWNQSNVNYSTTALRVAHTTAGAGETDDRSERVSVCIFSS